MFNVVNDAASFTQRSITFARDLAQGIANQAFSYLPELPAAPTLTGIRTWLSDTGFSLDAATRELCFSVSTDETVGEVPITDARFFSNQVRSVSTSPAPQDQKDLVQFMKDLPRFTAVISNGVEVARENYDLLLETWANMIHVATDLDIQTIKNIICKLNQTFGNVSLKYVSQFTNRSAVNGTPVDFFRTLQQSELCTQILRLDGLKVSLEYILPLQAFTADPNANREAEDLTADLIFKTVFTCNFELNPNAKDFSTHIMTFTKGDTGFQLQFPKATQLRESPVLR